MTSNAALLPPPTLVRHDLTGFVNFLGTGWRCSCGQVFTDPAAAAGHTTTPATP